MMTRMIKSLGLAAIVPLALAACGGGGGGGSGTVSTTTPPATATTTAFQDKFGTAFSADFNASTTTDAKHPASSDVPALNTTAEPLDN